MKIFSFIQKCLHLLFQLYSNCICMCIIVSEVFFSKKSSILSITLVILYFIIHMLDENLQVFPKISLISLFFWSFLHFNQTMLIWKTSVTTENVSNIFNKVLIILYAYKYISKIFQENLHIFSIYFLNLSEIYKNLQFY